MNVSKVLSGVGLMLCLCALSGCGGGKPQDTRPMGSVSGKLTTGGTPMTQGAVIFTSETQVNEAFAAELTGTGEFSVPTPVPAGSYIVSASPPTPQPTDKPADPNAPNPVPEKYRIYTTSDYKVEVKTGENKFDIDLK